MSVKFDGPASLCSEFSRYMMRSFLFSVGFASALISSAKHRFKTSFVLTICSGLSKLFALRFNYSLAFVLFITEVFQLLSILGKTKLIPRPRVIDSCQSCLCTKVLFGKASNVLCYSFLLYCFLMQH